MYASGVCTYVCGTSNSMKKWQMGMMDTKHKTHKKFIEKKFTPYPVPQAHAPASVSSCEIVK